MEQIELEILIGILLSQQESKRNKNATKTQVGIDIGIDIDKDKSIIIADESAEHKQFLEKLSKDFPTVMSMKEKIKRK